MLGVVSAFHPDWVAETMRWAVALVAAPVLLWAANTSMLGVSRHIYTLAINRQIPSWLGKLREAHDHPLRRDHDLRRDRARAGRSPPTSSCWPAIYAFGATLAITIAHLSIIRLRVKDPDKPRPFRIPLGMRWGPAELPMPAILAAVLSGLAFLSVLAFHATARFVGIGWMAFGLLFYVVYRKVFEGTTLTKRVSVPEHALTKQVPEVEFRNILVPVFGTKFDDDIVATAGPPRGGRERGRRRRRRVAPGGRLRDRGAADPAARREAAAGARGRRRVRALERAREVGEEYEDVEVGTEVIRARKVGAGILEAARRSGAEAIVIGGEPPTKIRGGATIGGIGAAKPAEIGAATEYVLKKAPAGCC